MAVDASFTIVAQNPTVEYLGGTRTRPVVTVAFTTHAHGIYGEARVLQEAYSAPVARAAASGIATILETFANLPHVVGVEWGQSVNPSGFLVDNITVTVASDSGDSTGQLGPWAITSIPPNLHQPLIEALNNQLTAAEGPSE